jgi:hypothetical protein
MASSHNGVGRLSQNAFGFWRKCPRSVRPVRAGMPVASHESPSALTRGRQKSTSRELCPALSSRILALLGELYEIEGRRRESSVAECLALRQQESAPVMVRLLGCGPCWTAKLRGRRCPRASLGDALSYLPVAGWRFRSSSALAECRESWHVASAQCRLLWDHLGAFLLAERREPPGFPTVIPDGSRRAATK